MKKKLLLYTSFMIALMVIVISCSEDEAPVLQERQQNLSINNPGATVVLNFSFPDNPALSLEWEETAAGADSYSVMFSTAADFATSSQLGQSSTNNFTITVADLNTFLLDAGADPYATFPFFLRIEGGGETSEAQSFSAVPYAAASPGIQTPATTDFVLDINAPDDPIVMIAFEDFSPGNVGNADDSDIQLQYTLQTALGGTQYHR
ncbi:MAG: SusE domain-containing protein, partial [Bacteroidota bacterium]